MERPDKKPTRSNRPTEEGLQAQSPSEAGAGPDLVVPPPPTMQLTSEPLPVGLHFTLATDEVDSDEFDAERVTPAGSVWVIVEQQPVDDPIMQYSVVCKATGGWIHLGHTELSGMGFKPLAAEWTPQDSLAAMEQGWEVFETDQEFLEAYKTADGKPYEPRRFKLQKLDEANLFKGDLDAWVHVRMLYDKGDPLATRAAEFMRVKSPAEFTAVFSNPVASLASAQQPEPEPHGYWGHRLHDVGKMPWNQEAWNRAGEVGRRLHPSNCGAYCRALRDLGLSETETATERTVEVPRYTHEQIAAAKKCLQLQLRLWDAERVLEIELGDEDIDSLGNEIKGLCAALGDPEDVTDKEALNLLDNIEMERTKNQPRKGLN